MARPGRRNEYGRRVVIVYEGTGYIYLYIIQSTIFGRAPNDFTPVVTCYCAGLSSLAKHRRGVGIRFLDGP